MDETQAKNQKRSYQIAIVLILIIHLLSFAPTPIIFIKTREQVKNDLESINFDTDVPGIVFGASVTIHKTPSRILKDRLDTAARLFINQKINKIVLSGNDDPPYNEVSVMRDYLLKEYGSIQEEDLILDGYGYRTYDTCIRSSEILGIKKAILITSGYHLPRSLFLCNNLGVESIGVNATLTDYDDKEIFYFREIYAIDKALIDLYIQTPSYSTDPYIESFIQEAE